MARAEPDRVSLSDAPSPAVRGIRNAFKAALGRLLTQTILLVSAFLIPRIMGPEAYGGYAALVAILAIVQSLVTLGLPLVEVRSLAPLWSTGRAEEALGLGSTIWLAKVVLAAVGGLLVTLWIAVSPELTSGYLLAIVVGLAGSSRFAFEGTKNLLVAFDRVGRMSLLEALRALLTLLIVAFLFSLSSELGVVFGGLAASNALLFLAAAMALLPVLPFRLAVCRWSLLAPHLGFGMASHVGAVARVIQAQLVVYIVAVSVQPRIAGFVGLAVQVYAIGQTLFLTVRRSIMPVLAELEATGQRDRLRLWSELISRYVAAFGTLATWCWALSGEWLTTTLISDEFLPICKPVLIILMASVLLAWGEACNGILLVQGRGLTVSVTLVGHAAFTLLGLLSISKGDGTGVPEYVAWLFLSVSILFFLNALLFLRLVGGVGLRVGGSLLLLLPAPLSLLLLDAELTVEQRVLVGLSFLVLFVGAAVSSRLLPVSTPRGLLRR